MHLQGRNKHFCGSKSLAAEKKNYYAKESTEFNYLYIVSHRAQKENISLVILKVGYIKAYLSIYLYIYCTYIYICDVIWDVCYFWSKLGFH